jgi:indole-3-glycerol phosphate synthase
VLDVGKKSFFVSAKGKRVPNDTRSLIREPPEFKRHVYRSRYTFCIPMATKLEEIVAAARRRVAAAKATVDLRALEMRADRHRPRGLRTALQERAASGVAIIAELKKASPSKGVIRQDFPVAELAGDLEQAGAAALSVLTDEEYFQGSLQNLATASQSTKLPCLRKDFMVDELQIVEARANGADAILLIVAALSHEELISLAAAARANNLDVLCEVHDSAELQCALDAGFETIGINNRDLHTFRVDLNTSLQLVEGIPPGVVKVAESGIETAEDIARLRQAGFDAFLIGESLMRAKDPGNELRGLLGHAVSAG